MARARFSRWLATWFSTRPATPARKAKASRKMWLETLEDRTAPAAFVVTTTADSGAGSLRAAITSSDTTAGANTINFNIPTSDTGFNSTTGAFTINLVTPLPQVNTNAVVIDGTTEKTFISSTKTYPIVTLNGSALAATANGLDLNVTATSVKGLNLQKFGNDAILVEAAATNAIIQGNYLGTAVTGTTAAKNNYGVELRSSGATVGGTTAAARNVISGNLVGVHLDSGASSNTIEGNYIGTDATGSVALGNTHGVWLDDDGSNNTIGGTVAGAGNVLSANAASGIIVKANNATIFSESIQGNLIGTNAAGTGALGNVTGITVTTNNVTGLGSISGLTIGGLVAGARNTISGNTADGIALTNSNISGITIQGNYIGTTSAGSAKLGNGGNGINITDVTTVTIGGTTAGARNVISGNAGSGILATGAASNITVQGNLVGTDVTGTVAIGNSTGIMVVGAASSVTIGGTVAGSRNVVSGNTGDGIIFASHPVPSQFGGVSPPGSIQGNFIGTTLAGTGKLGNGGNGIILGTATTSVGGNTAAARNIISANGKNGVVISGRFATSNTIQGNYIGTDVTGAVGLGNVGDGIYIVNAPNNSIGLGSNQFGVSGLGNVISGNLLHGVVILGPSATNNTLSANLIGTNAAGTAKLPNTGSGVYIDGASGNFVQGGGGGFTVISGNGQFGVLIAGPGASNNHISDALIGTDITGTVALGNGASGVYFANAGGNAITGAVISANAGNGVLICGGFAANDSINSSYIGTDVNGSIALGNTLYGIQISNAPSTSIGAGGNFANGTGNIISGNKKDGIYITGPSAVGTSIAGNSIGTDLTGILAIPNAGNGITNYATSTTIRGNLISGNSGYGLLIAGTYGTGTSVLANFIGTDVTGTIPVPNGSSGIIVASPNNTIGSVQNNQFQQFNTGTGNLISGNNGSGILLAGALASGNNVLGNYIGVDALGGSALPNSSDGVTINNAPSNIIGGSSPSDGNLISGNKGNGVNILGPAATGNDIEENHIGLDATGTLAIANANGVVVNAPNNTIGGVLTVGATGADTITSNIPVGNVISGNTGSGVLVQSAGTGTVITANLIGTDHNGILKLANGSSGIRVLGASGVAIGGNSAQARNVISGNTGSGISLESNTTGATIARNIIGLDVNGVGALANTSNGITILSGSGNTIGGTDGLSGNVISQNGGSGISLSAGAGNGFLGNSIFNNVGAPIAETAGTNNSIAAPTLSTATRSASGVTINGSISGANGTYRVELFGSTLTGQAQTFLGFVSVTISSGGAANFSFLSHTVATGQFITATVTDPSNDTSKVSNALTSP